MNQEEPPARRADARGAIGTLSPECYPRSVVHIVHLCHRNHYSSLRQQFSLDFLIEMPDIRV